MRRPARGGARVGPTLEPCPLTHDGIAPVDIRWARGCLGAPALAHDVRGRGRPPDPARSRCARHISRGCRVVRMRRGSPPLDGRGGTPRPSQLHRCGPCALQPDTARAPQRTISRIISGIAAHERPGHRPAADARARDPAAPDPVNGASIRFTGRCVACKPWCGRGPVSERADWPSRHGSLRAQARDCEPHPARARRPSRRDRLAAPRRRLC